MGQVGKELRGASQALKNRRPSEANIFCHAEMVSLSLGKLHDAVEGQTIKSLNLTRHSHPCFAQDMRANESGAV